MALPSFVLKRTGFSGFMWCIIFWFVAHSDPANHPRIAYDEREYLLAAANSNKSESRYPDERKMLRLPCITCISLMFDIVGLVTRM